MSTTWKKIGGDLRQNLVPLLLVAGAISIGALALSAAFSSRTVMTREMNRNYRGTSPVDVTFWLDSVSASLANKIAALPPVADAEPRRLIRARAQISNTKNNMVAWRPLRTFVIADFNNLRVSTFRSISGNTAPGIGEALIEQSALPVLNVRQGDSLAVRVPGGQLRKVLVSGIVHDAGQAPGWQDNAGYAYITPKTARLLGASGPFDQLNITLTNGRIGINEQAIQISRYLTQKGLTVNRVEVSEGKHPHADQMQTMLTLLTFFFHTGNGSQWYISCQRAVGHTG